MDKKDFNEIRTKLSGPDSCDKQSTQPDWDYFNILYNHKIRLIILGLDPYPCGSTGIPFHKNDWTELNIRNHSFDAIVEGLNLMEKIKLAESNGEKPIRLFELLAKECGIAFLNVCYKPCDGKITYKKCREDLKDSLKLNKEILSRGAMIICCGKKVERALKWAYENDAEFLQLKKHTPYHPGCRGNDRNSQANFIPYWTTGKLLQERFYKPL